MIIKIDNNCPDNVLKIEYMLGNICNQKCNYCFSGSNEGDQVWPELSDVKKTLSCVLNEYKQSGKDTFEIFFAGGEPTLWDDFLPLCEYLKSKFNCILKTSTNGTRSVIWWTKAGRVLDCVNISVHHEYARVIKIIKLADYLHELGVFVNIDVLIDPAHFKKCIELVDQLKASRHEWPITAKAVLYNGESKYTDDQKIYFVEPIKRYLNKL